MQDFCAGLGVRLILVLGLKQQIDSLIRGAGSEPRYEGGYRITDEIAMVAAAEAIGAARAEVEARLSKVCSPLPPPQIHTHRPGQRTRD